MARTIGKLRSACLGLGAYVGRRTDLNDVRTLIRALRPFECDKELIRIGGNGDGGYIIPDDLEGIDYCFSPGVNTICNFESELADRGIKSFMADYSVDGPPLARPEFVFEQKYIGASDRENYVTLASWKDKYLKHYTGDLLLQMDIEGSEYEVILSTPDELLNQFRIMAIEFHYLDRLFDPFTFSLLSSCFHKILKQFYVVHIHPNNVWPIIKVRDIQVPPLLEFTFVNRRRGMASRPRRNFSSHLDFDNSNRKRIPLPKCWYT